MGVVGRWYWCVRMEENRAAVLPTQIANQVERLICMHRKDRKTLLEKQPPKWEEKLQKVNDQVMTMVWNKKTCAMADPAYVKKATRTLHGKLEFVDGSGRGFELIRLTFSPASPEDPTGPGTYTLSSDCYPARPLCCISGTTERTGFDLLREAYAGQVI